MLYVYYSRVLYLTGLNSLQLRAFQHKVKPRPYFFFLSILICLSIFAIDFSKCFNTGIPAMVYAEILHFTIRITGSK